MKTFKLLISDNPKAREICAGLMIVCHTAMEEGEDVGPNDVFEALMMALIAMIHGADAADSIGVPSHHAAEFLRVAMQSLRAVEQGLTSDKN